jgi:hypothetical protein
LQHKITELTSRLTGNQQAVQAEILVLEEENIELLKENKELRNQVLDYQMRAERGAVSSVSSSLEGRRGEKRSNETIASGAEVTRISADDNSSKKPKLDASDENQPTGGDKLVIAAVLPEAPLGRRFGDTLDGNVIDAPAAAAGTSGAVAKRRTRIKAKPNDSFSTSGQAAPADTGPECAQS